MPERIDFFPNQKRKVTIEDVYPKLNKENEKRIHIKMKMPLLGESILGMPGQIGHAYEYIGKAEGAGLEAILASEFEAMTLEFYPHDQADAPREKLVTGATLRKMIVSRPAAETRANDEIALYFETTVRDDSALFVWLYQNLGATLFCRFEQAQMSLVTDGKAAAANDQPEQDELITSTEAAIDQMERDRRADVAAMTPEEKAALEASYQAPKRGRRSAAVAH